MGLRTFANLRLFVSRYCIVGYASRFWPNFLSRKNNLYEEEAGIIQENNRMIEIRSRQMLLLGGDAIRRYSARAIEKAPAPWPIAQKSPDTPCRMCFCLEHDAVFSNYLN